MRMVCVAEDCEGMKRREVSLIRERKWKCRSISYASLTKPQEGDQEKCG